MRAFVALIELLKCHLTRRSRTTLNQVTDHGIYILMGALKGFFDCGHFLVQWSPTVVLKLYIQRSDMVKGLEQLETGFFL